MDSEKDHHVSAIWKKGGYLIKDTLLEAGRWRETENLEQDIYVNSNAHTHTQLPDYRVKCR